MRTGKRPASPHGKPTQHMEASRQDASADLKSKDSSDFRLLPESLLTIDSSDDEVYTDSLTSHTTASDSTIGNLTSPLDPISSRVEEPKIDSKTESQFGTSMPYLEESIPLIDDNYTFSAINVSDSHDSVFVSDPSPDISSSISSPDTPIPIPQRSTRSTKGKPLRGMERSTTLITLVDMGSYFQCPCDYCTGK